MTKLEIPDYWGKAGEDAVRHLKILDYNFLPLSRQYSSEEGMSESEAKCYALLMSTKGTARKWMDDQSDELMANWEGMKNAFISRFPRPEKKSTNKAKEALTAMYNFKQRGRSYDDYFEEAREIKNNLHETLHEDIAERTLEGIDNDNVKGIAGGILGEGGATDLDQVIKTIRGIARPKARVEDKPSDVDDKYFGMSNKDKMMLQMFEQNSNAMTQNATVMDRFTASFANLNMRGATMQPFQPNRNVQPSNGVATTGHNQQGERPMQQRPRIPSALAEARKPWVAPEGQRPRTDLTTSAGSKGNYYQGQGSSAKCWRCGVVGHTAGECTASENAVLSQEEQARMKNEFYERKRAAEAAKTIPSIATGANAIPINQMNTSSQLRGPPPVSVHQVEEVEENALTTWNRPIRDVNAVESLYTGEPGTFHRSLEEFDAGDDDTLIKEVFNVDDICHACTCAESRRIEEAMALGDKRARDEFESDGVQEDTPARRASIKRQRNSQATQGSGEGPSRTRSYRPSTTSNTSLGPELVVPPLEPAPRKSPARKGAPPKIRLRAMGDVEPWDADEYLRTLRVDVGLLQLLHMCPSARSGVVNGVRLEPNPKKTKKTRFVEEMPEVSMAEATQHDGPEDEDDDEDESGDEEEAIHDIFTVETVNEEMEDNEFEVMNVDTAGEPVITKVVNQTPKPSFQSKARLCDTCHRFHHQHQANSQFLPLQMKDASGRSSGKSISNFYTHGLVTSHKSADPVRVWRVLLDPGSTLNLIAKRVVDKIGCIVHNDSSIAIRIANGEIQKLPGYTNVRLKISGAEKNIRAYIVPGDVSFNMLLGRQWLRDTSAVGHYREGIYYLHDDFGNQHLIECDDPARITTPEVFISDGANLDNLSLDEETLNDLEYEGQERTDMIIREIMSQADEEMWDDYEDLQQELESDDNDAISWHQGKGRSLR